MKKFLLAICILAVNGASLLAQITPNGNSGSTTTAYTNGSPNDPIYIWCAEGLSNNTASLTATPASGTGPFTFNWYYHNQTNSSWTNYSTSTGATSTISNLASDGYRVQIYSSGGALVGCYTAWVWNMNGQVTASQSPTACNASNLTGTVASNGSFTYYNPPPPESLISASTVISVCFSATHTYVSDLAFYLVGPASCGSPTIMLSPNPGANGQGSVCNSNNNVSGLCFTTAASPNFDPCNENCCGFLCFDVTGCTSNYSGTYDSYGPSSTPINWSALYGCNAAQGGWAVQIYDCIGADVGSLTNASISFSNLTSVCGSPTSLNYTSGAINSAINDNSCSAGTASIFQVPVSTSLSTPITINASTSYLWTASPVIAIPNASTSLTPSVTGLPNGSTTFTLTATVTYGSTTCTYDEVATFINTCCAAVANAGPNASFCTGGNAQLGTASVANMTYSWSPATGLNDATLAQPTVTLTNITGAPVTTSYTLTVTDVLNGGCTATDAVDVTVNPNPTVNAGSDQSVCEGTSVTLAGSGASTYTWNNGVTNAIAFTPALGTVTYTVTGTSVEGCVNTDAVDVTVNANPIVNAGTYGPVCVDAANIVLSGTPSGGTFSGTGVSGTTFTPSTGTQLITYAYTDANSCSNTATTTITVNALPIVSAGTYAAVCADAANVTLAGSPSGGTFSGTGVTGTSFSPSSGTQTITYTYTDANSCTNSTTTTITVNALPVVNAGSYTAVCIDAPDVALAGTPVGGTFTGIGVTGNAFDPSVGTQTITYSYTDGNSCSNSATTSITVVNPSSISAGTYAPVCASTPTVALVGTPAGGTFTGTGVSGNTFNTSAGTQLITYDYVDGNGCGGTATTTITVNSLPVVSAGTYTAVCQNAPNVTLSGSPVGGTFSGTGVGGGTFDPTSGTQTLTYNYTDGNGCSNSATTSITVNPLPTVNAGSYSDVCVDAADINLVGTPVGGTFSGTGVNGNLFDPSVGTQTITYAYTDANSCTNSSTTSITINQLPAINGGVDQTVCIGSSMALFGSGGVTYAWDNGGVDGQPFTPSLGTTLFTVTGTDANGCVNTDVVNVTALAIPVASFSADVTLGTSVLTVNFTNNSVNGSSYSWNFGNGSTVTSTTLNNQTASYATVGSYVVVLTASNGTCFDTDTLEVIVIPFLPPMVHVPNVFTPNGDGSNDHFIIDTEYAASLELTILNRWGNVVFETSEIDGKWDGQVNGNDASEGVYFFKYAVTGLNAEILEGHGNITLIR